MENEKIIFIIAGIIIGALLIMNTTKEVNLTCPAPQVNISDKNIIAQLNCPACPICSASANCTGGIKMNNILPAHGSVCNGTMKITGYSMEPTAFEGNTLDVEAYNGQELHAGMIIWFIYDGKLTVHRIKGIYPDKIITQGDNAEGTEQIQKSDIKYIVRGICFS